MTEFVLGNSCFEFFDEVFNRPLELLLVLNSLPLRFYLYGQSRKGISYNSKPSTLIMAPVH